MIRARLLVFTVVGLAASLVGPVPVAAHADLTSTTPVDGAELTSPPEEVVIVFDGELDPAASGFTVTDATGTEVGGGGVDLEVADRNEMRGSVAIAEPGTYTVTWSVQAADGHPSDGVFTFTVDGTTDGEGGAGTPNTAMTASTSPPPALLAGLALAAIAIGVAARRLGRAVA